jgi:heat shock protein HslJ
MENNILHFGDLAVTRAMVRDPEKERVFLEGLSAARGWSFEGNILVLEDERKKPVLRLYPLQRVKNIPVKK